MQFKTLPRPAVFTWSVGQKPRRTPSFTYLLVPALLRCLVFFDVSHRNFWCVRKDSNLRSPQRGSRATACRNCRSATNAPRMRESNSLNVFQRFGALAMRWLTVCLILEMEEEVGFEPTAPEGATVFETAGINRTRPLLYLDARGGVEPPHDRLCRPTPYRLGYRAFLQLSKNLVPAK